MLINELLFRKIKNSDDSFFGYKLAISEDMVKDGYEEIMNIDISSVAIEMMKRKHAHIPQLKCILVCGRTFF